MILISSHLDRVIQDFDLSYSHGAHTGLLDNFIGILISYLALYDDPNLQKLEAQGTIKLWHSKGEEWGMLYDHPKLTKKDLVIVVDVACNPKDYKDIDFSLENISFLSKKRITDLKAFLEWEGFKVKTKIYTGAEDEDDEAWSWRKLGIPCFSFIIPIQSPNSGWHRIQQDSTVSAQTVQVCKQALKRLICYFK